MSENNVFEREAEYDAILADMCETLNDKKYEEIPYAERANFFAFSLSMANVGIKRRLKGGVDKEEEEELKWRLQVNDKLIKYLERER